MRIFVKHEDPAHGWLAVRVKDAEAVGLSVADFSDYSYRSRAGTTLYLEEDCDASKFIEHWKLHNPGEVFWNYTRHSHTNKRHWIRSLPGIRG